MKTYNKTNIKILFGRLFFVFFLLNYAYSLYSNGASIIASFKYEDTFLTPLFIVNVINISFDLYLMYLCYRAIRTIRGYRIECMWDMHHLLLIYFLSIVLNVFFNPLLLVFSFVFIVPAIISLVLSIIMMRNHQRITSKRNRTYLFIMLGSTIFINSLSLIAMVNGATTVLGVVIGLLELAPVFASIFGIIYLIMEKNYYSD